MSIQKKSLISTLKTAKKANVASDSKGEKITSMRVNYLKTASSAVSARQISGKAMGFAKKSAKAMTFKSARAATTKVVL